jgi:hypothetical protein
MRQVMREVLLTLLLLGSFTSMGLMLATELRADTSTQGKDIWVGRIGGMTIRWSTSDIIVHPSDNTKEVRFSAKSLAQKDLEATLNMAREPSGTENRLALYERDFTMLSAVGSILSFQDHYFISFRHEAHPAGETRFTAIDLAKSGDVVKLTEFFSEPVILHALLADPLIKEALRSAGHPDTPKTLNELIERVSPGVFGFGGFCYSISDDLLTRFAFHHIEGNNVAVRIGLSGGGPCREALTQLGLLLPIPDSLKGALALAESGEEGFLMKDQKKIAHNQKATFKFVADKDTGN